MSVQSFRDLDCWNLAMEFVDCVYVLTRAFPLEERFGLTAQLRRAAVSIPSNLSEGHQQGTKAYLHFVILAIGSLAEAETQLDIARRLRMVGDKPLAPVLKITMKLRPMLHALKRSLQARLLRGEP